MEDKLTKGSQLRAMHDTIMQSTDNRRKYKYNAKNCSVLVEY